MFAWLREFYELRREHKICDGCEILKMQLAIANDDKSKLLDRILEKPADNIIVEEKEFKPLLPRNTSWRAKQQMLEAEDRQRAKLLKQQEAKPELVSTKDLEEELGIVEKEREGEKANAI